MEYALSLGSNLGDRRAHLVRARRRIVDLRGTKIVAASSLYETEPVDVAAAFADLPFLNAVLVIESTWTPEALNDALHALEAELGRVRTGDRNAPRPVDIDMIYADDIQCQGDALTLPHPRWAERRFVVEPLAEVRPGRVIPPVEVSVSELLLSLPASPRVVRWAGQRWEADEDVDGQCDSQQ